MGVATVMTGRLRDGEKNPPPAASEMPGMTRAGGRGSVAGGKVLVVEDEFSLASTISYNLKREGFDALTCARGDEAVKAAADYLPDLIILDIMLPGMDGFEVCRKIRRSSSVPILMLTARDEEIDRVVGLEIGADDYLTKPFSMRELIARTRAMLRRRTLLREELVTAEAEEGRDDWIESDDLRVNTATRDVFLAEKPIRLRPKEFDLLTFLLKHKRQVFSAERLLDLVWGYEAAVDTGTVSVHVSNLRRKIERDASQPLRLETVRGVGYRFVR